jgi:hypothetical protein
VPSALSERAPPSPRYTLTAFTHEGEPAVLSSPTPDQVRSLAPDPGAARAGEGLAGRGHWSSTGRNERAAWGLCHGSGANPYQVAVDFGGPAFTCMAAAVGRRDVAAWAAERGLVVTKEAPAGAV